MRKKKEKGTETDFTPSARAYRNQRDLEIYTEFQTLTSVEGCGKVNVMVHLMKKHKLHSLTSVYNSLHRVEERIKTGTL